MVKISDLKVGDVIKNEFNGITRERLQQYAKASGDTNPIHTSDAIAEKAGLKGIIAHGLFSYGLLTKLFEDWLEQGNFGKLIEIDVEMRGMVRCGDLLLTEGKITKIEGKRVFFDVTQTTITGVDIKDQEGKEVFQFEAGERGYISEKDISLSLVHEKVDNFTITEVKDAKIKGSDFDFNMTLSKTTKVEEGILTYRERISTPGTAMVELNE